MILDLEVNYHEGHTNAAYWVDGVPMSARFPELLTKDQVLTTLRYLRKQLRNQ